MSPPRHFLFATTHISDELGGSEYLWIETASSLQKKGYPVTAIIPSHYPHNQEIHNLASEGVTIIRFPFAPWHFIPNPLGTFLKKQLHKPLTYHTITRTILKHCKKKAPPLTCLILNRTTHLNGIPIATALHRRSIPYANIIQAAADWHWPVIGHIPTMRQSYTNALHNYFVSHRIRETTENHIGTLLPNATIIVNPVRIPLNSAIPWPPPSPLRLACVARLYPISKGQDLALRLIASPTWRERDIHITFYGEGPYRPTLQNLAQSLGIAHKVTFAGYENDLTKIWSTHHALLLPSRHEGMPLAILEAMATARPCITTDVGGHTEWIEHGINGFIAPAPTLSSLHKAFEEAWQRRDQLPQIGQNARATILSRFSQNAGAFLAEPLISLTKTKL
jgi:glycosyltransferase involved in cell wall biosynthesis